jgi:mannose-6-phosphate isomerase-like protein (cupin superfamily)
MQSATTPGDLLKLDEQTEAEKLRALPEPYVELFRRGDFSIELFSPRGVDTQTPHDQDEVYIVSRGTGMFRRGAEAVEFRSGDLLFVAAGVRHRFEEFSADFRTWVIFFGPRS